MANFNQALQRVAEAEGGYQNIPEDTGNYNSLGQLVGTNFGINAQVYEAWIGFPPSQSDMQNMPQNVANQIYKANFWDDIRGDEIFDQSVAEIFFDGRVNHGRTGTRLMQEVLGVTQDTIVGPITLNAINSSIPSVLYNAYKQRRIDFYFEIVDARPNQQIFLQGWLNRMAEFNDFDGVSNPPILNPPTPSNPTPNSTPTTSTGTGGFIAVALSAIALFFFSRGNR